MVTAPLNAHLSDAKTVRGPAACLLSSILNHACLLDPSVLAWFCRIRCDDTYPSVYFEVMLNTRAYISGDKGDKSDHGQNRPTGEPR